MKELIWYEKYRQKDLSALSLDNRCRAKMEEYIEEEQIPHLLFTGPPGSGKTTLAKILTDHCASSLLELNGSSEDRGIGVMTGRVVRFAKSMRRSKKKKNIVFIDEADGLTPGAQKALKNTIEKRQKNCRFIFTANTFGDIDEAIYSRCQHYKFEQIPKKKIVRYCTKILKAEKIKYSKKDVKTIVDKFFPDIRTVLNNLQSCSIGFEMNLDHMLEVDIDLKELSKLIKKGRIGEIREKWAGTISFVWLWNFLIDEFIPKMKDNQAAAASAISVAEYMWRSSQDADREIYATACLIDICQNLDLEVIF